MGELCVCVCEIVKVVILWKKSVRMVFTLCLWVRGAGAVPRDTSLLTATGIWVPTPPATAALLKDRASPMTYRIPF